MFVVPCSQLLPAFDVHAPGFFCHFRRQHKYRHAIHLRNGVLNSRLVVLKRQNVSVNQVDGKPDSVHILSST